MPEGDTIFRTASTLRSALAGQTVTEVSTTVRQLLDRGVERLAAQTIDAVESRGKHLLLWFSPSDLALHTHMGMNGSWHLYRPGEAWRKPRRAGRLVVATTDWRAVCFSPQICRLLARAEVERDAALATLGPDALDDQVDLAEAMRRLDQRWDWSVGEALLDQRVLAGVGNVYKSEVLFINAVDPWTRVADLSEALRGAVLQTAVRLLRANAGPGPLRRTTTEPGSAGRLHVYARAGRACRRCGDTVRAARQGQQARVTYWCPGCQGAGPGGC